MDGVDYHFVTLEEFRRKIEARDFLEWAIVHQDHYGTDRHGVGQDLTLGLDLMLTIDVQGAAQIRKQGLPAVSVFLLPPSLAALEERLRLRDQDSAESIEVRLQNARGEIAAAEQYDYIVVNDDLEDAVARMRAIVTAKRCERERWLPLLREME